MLRVGIIGTGYWGPNLVRVFHDCPGSCVTAVCDLDSDRIDQIRSRYPTIEGHLNAQELIERPDVDLVAIATPVDTHHRLALAAIEQGKHVLVEKPMTQTAAEAEELIERARAQGTLLAVDHTFLFTPAVVKMKELIDQGHLGELNYIDSVRINLGLIQEEINVIWDLAPHDLSILDYLLGRIPRRVVATGACHTVGGQVDVAYINLDYGDGLIVNLHVNWLSPVKVRRMILGGTRKMIIFDDLSNSEKVRVYHCGADPVSEQNGGNGKRLKRVDYRIGDIWTPHLPPQEALATQASHLVSAVKDGTPLRVDGHAGLRVVRILEACHESLSEDGKRVTIEAEVKPLRLTTAPDRLGSCNGNGHRAGKITKPKVTSGSPPLPDAAKPNREDSPSGEDMVPLAKPLVGDSECAAVADVLRSGWLMQGPRVQRFEKAVADYVGAEHAVAVSSGTAALHLTLHAMGIGAGDEVVVPSFTFIATANAVRYCGATPVFADVDIATYNVSPSSVERVVTPKTKAIIAVHQFGLPAELRALTAIADAHGCVLIEDAACALGSSYEGKRIGTHSTAGCFSFHPRKVITTGEGGMMVTNDGELADRIRRLRQHGMDLSNWQRHGARRGSLESYVEVGFSYRLNDVCAAVGLAQMDRLDDILAARRVIGEDYDQAFRNHPFLQVCKASPQNVGNYQSYGVWLTDDAPVDRDTYLARLNRLGIGAKHGVNCIHREPCYRADHGKISLPNSELLSERMVLLPMFPEMSNEQRERTTSAAFEALGLDPPFRASVSLEWAKALA